MAVTWLLERVDTTNLVMRFDPAAGLSESTTDGLTWRLSSRPLAWHHRGEASIEEITERQAQELLAR